MNKNDTSIWAEGLRKASPRILIILSIILLLIVGLLTYEYQVFLTRFTYYVPSILVLSAFGSFAVLFLSIKRKRLILAFSLVMVSVLLLSFSIWTLSHSGPILSLNSPDKYLSENQIIKRVIYFYYDHPVSDRTTVVHPIDYYYGIEGKDELKKQFHQFSTLLDQFYELNNPSELTLQSDLGDGYSVDNSKTNVGDSQFNVFDLYVSAPAYDPKSGYIIEYSGGGYGGRLAVFRYKLGKFIYIETLDSWFF